LCTKWLVGVPISVKTTKLINQNVFVTNEKHETEHFVFAENDIHVNHIKKCFYCSSENDIQMMTANPFTRKNKLFVCTNCLKESDLTP
jgi:superfamily II helicase